MAGGGHGSHATTGPFPRHRRRPVLVEVHERLLRPIHVRLGPRAVAERLVHVWPGSSSSAGCHHLTPRGGSVSVKHSQRLIGAVPRFDDGRRYAVELGGRRLRPYGERANRATLPGRTPDSHVVSALRDRRSRGFSRPVANWSMTSRSQCGIGAFRSQKRRTRRPDQRVPLRFG